ncbi:MAG: 4-hydroxy-tetrahydrodipicolinate synthase [Alphaproteobacteria bacterium]|nr:4-hydroxy-tetrahydrodipicolinate synthase [Alphaproteobacteria bacterium]
MKKVLFSGSGCAVVTPFTKDGKINFDKLAQLVEFQIANKTDAIIACGTTGEASIMTDDEHTAVVEFIVKQTAKRIPVIAGTGSNSTHHAVELTQKAEKAGADGILAVVPYYNKTSQKGLYEHFTAIAKSVKIPVILYNVPSRTNYNINPQTICKLASDNSNIVGVKECNLYQAGDVVNLCGKDFSVYSGDDNIILPIMSMGGKGIISVMANIIPEDTHLMTSEFLSGNLKAAIALQLKTLDLISALFCEPSPMPIKAAMNLMGMDVGPCRLPLVDVEKSTLDRLRDELIKYGLLDSRQRIAC